MRWEIGLVVRVVEAEKGVITKEFRKIKKSEKTVNIKKKIGIKNEFN